MATLPKVELKKLGAWSGDEDKILVAYIQQHGHQGWRTLPEKAGLARSGKSCRLRWTNYLRPGIKREKFSNYEEKSIIRLHALFGNKWSVIATYLPNRSDNEIKNYWSTRLRKRLARMGIDPTTHKSKKNQPASSATISHMAQWEARTLQAEARQSSTSILFNRATAPPVPKANNYGGQVEMKNILTITENEIYNTSFVSTNNYSGQVEMKNYDNNIHRDHVINYPVMIGSMHNSIHDNLVPLIGDHYNYCNDLLDLVNSSCRLL